MIEMVIHVVKFGLRWAEAVWFYARAITRKLASDDILFLASGLAFNGILTMIPLFLLAASALGSFLESSTLALSRMRDFLDAVFPPQPFATSIKDSILTMVGDIVEYRRSLGVFGALILVWTATSLFDALRSVLHTIYGLQRTRSMLRALLHHVGFVLLAFILFLVSSVAVWMLSLVEGIARSLPGVSGLDFSAIHQTLPTVIITVLTAVMFYIVFRYIPDSKPPRVAGIISTLTTTVLWVVSGKLFAVYLSGFSAIGKIYGPYAFILVLLIWVYYSSIVFILGAVVGQVYWERLKLKEAGLLERWV